MLSFGGGWNFHRHHNVVPEQHGGAAQAVDAAAENAGVRAQTKPRPEGVLDEVANALASARAAISHTLELLSLETRRAGLTVMWMVALGIAAAMLAVAAWLGFMGALALCAVAYGVTWITAIIVLALINLLAAAIVMFVCVRMSRDLLFAATRRQIAGKPVPAPQP